jgi:hypothetical protein
VRLELARERSQLKSQGVSSALFCMSSRHGCRYSKAGIIDASYNAEQN